MNAPLGVLNSLDAPFGCSLTDSAYKICSRGAIKRLHSIHSIFHLLCIIRWDIAKKSRHWCAGIFMCRVECLELSV